MKAVVGIEDYIAHLEHSSLPTLLTEGRVDCSVLQKLETRLSDIDIDFLPVGGKDAVYEVMNRLSPKRQKMTAALVDMDLWVYSGIPEGKKRWNFIYTEGYSIENDLYVDSQIEDLISDTEIREFRQRIDVVSQWHSRECLKIMKGDGGNIALHPEQIFNKIVNLGNLTDEECELYNQIKESYASKLRGHTLFYVLLGILSGEGRRVRYSHKQIYDMAAARPASIFARHEDAIRGIFQAA